MTKHAIRALSIGLRQELMVDKLKGIDVCTVMPGSTDTPLFQHGANYTGWLAKPMSPVYPPEKVARAIVACAQSPSPEVFVGGAPRMMYLQAHLAPRLAERDAGAPGRQGPLRQERSFGAQRRQSLCPHSPRGRDERRLGQQEGSHPPPGGDGWHRRSRRAMAPADGRLVPPRRARAALSRADSGSVRPTIDSQGHRSDRAEAAPHRARPSWYAIDYRRGRSSRSKNSRNSS